MSRKGANSRAHGRKLRSTGTKSKGVARSDEQAALVKKLKAHAGDLEKKLEAGTRELGEARNHLAESQQQQTATADVLRVISSSSGDLEPIFQTILENATRICEASFCTLFLCHDGGAIRMAASCQLPAALYDYLRARGTYAPPAASPLVPIIRTKQLLHSPDTGRMCSTRIASHRSRPRRATVMSICRSAPARVPASA